jgi:23S rRNA (uridine2552-2'-O)-methyltransferase
MSNFKVKDHYFNKAKNENYLARSIYKLEEIDEKYKILKSGMMVVDFGYHPGSWIQYTSEVIGDEGKVVGIDVREVNKKLSGIKNVRVYQKDIFDIQDLGQLEVDGQFDVVLSDMAPNTTGIKSLDQDRSLNLVESVFGLLPKFLKPGGNFVIKVFDSQNAQNYLKDQKNLFKEFHYLKPKSTRSISKEFFVIGKQFKA